MVPWLWTAHRNLVYSNPHRPSFSPRLGQVFSSSWRWEVPCTTLLGWNPLQEYSRHLSSETRIKSTFPRNPIRTVIAYWDMTQLHSAPGRWEVLLRTERAMLFLATVPLHVLFSLPETPLVPMLLLRDSAKCPEALCSPLPTLTAQYFKWLFIQQPPLQTVPAC